MAEKFGYEEFVRTAIVRLRIKGLKGIHTLYSGFDRALKIYYEGADPLEVLNKLSQEGKIVMRPVKGGLMLYLPEDEPSPHFLSKGVTDFLSELKNAEGETQEIDWNLRALGEELYQACEQGDLAKVNLRLQSGAEVNYKYAGVPLLFVAARQGHKDIVKVLIKAGANVNELDGDGFALIHYLASTENKTMVELFIEVGATVNVKSNEGKTPLMRAVQSKNRDIVEILIDAGANVHERDLYGWTALTFAVDGVKEIVELLIDSGANVNEEDEHGFTVIEHAFLYKNKEIIDLLIDAGADTDEIDYNGLAAIDQSANVIEETSKKADAKPSLNIAVIGIITRDYAHKYQNGYRDFSNALPDALVLLDQKGCDAVLCSLFSIVPRQSYDPSTCFTGLKNIKAVFIEEFEDGSVRTAKRYVVHHRVSDIWEQYAFNQKFVTLTGMREEEINSFVNDEMPKRIMGNCCVLLCGETNGVKYSPIDMNIHDIFGLRDSIPQTTNIILNPIHDRMTRFEMKLKRKFLSENNRWVISVWNKGKKDKNGVTKDGVGPAWTVYNNRNEIYVPQIPNNLGVDLGVVDCRKA